MASGDSAAFAQVYKDLNNEQQAAVDQTDGPLLVIAGPGTGKTQLLSARVARILQATDTLPQNILCLTFTENGAINMRERLTRFIGPAAYDVNIGTYHAFGAELIRRFPEYFPETRLQNSVDELGKRQIIGEIVEAMSYSDPLKSSRYHLGDLISTISEVKRALLDEKSLNKIAAENSEFITSAGKITHEVFDNFTKMPSKAGQALEYFEKLFAELSGLAPQKPANPKYGSLASIALSELEDAITGATAENSTKMLTAWKNKWLAKDSKNRFILAGDLQNKRIESLAQVFQKYQTALNARGLYDFDDMIIRAVEALEQNKDLLATLQEQYLYILLDEFQDTNAAQLKLIKLLTNNVVNEEHPNVMAVGDDDQAIYAFQGAQYSNMLDFYKMYRDVTVVNLTQNYRSHSDILHVAHQVVAQIGERLEQHFDGMSKILISANAKLPKVANIERQEFLSDVGQYDWISKQIEKLIAGGVSASQIAVLAPRHRYIEPLGKFLNALKIPVRYEKRENILEAKVVLEIINMTHHVLALGANDQAAANTLWPEVLSYEFWQIPTRTIWEISWKVNDSKGKLNWSQVLLQDKNLNVPALLMLTLANKTNTETLETMLDYLIGTEAVETNDTDAPLVQSPLRAYYTNAKTRAERPELFYQTLSHLTVLRQKLRDHQASSSQVLKLSDLLEFVGLYEAAEERMINTSPYNQHAEAVQLMTVFKAKGLEFEHVFLPNCQDDVWGESSRGSSNHLTLPANLAPIRHAGTNEDERLRIFFVAITRAKIGLHLTSFLQTYAGKTTKRLKYLNEQEQPDGTFKSLVLPELSQGVSHVEMEVPDAEILEVNWQNRHVAGLTDTSLRDLLNERLENYQLSATHLNTFTDMVHGGPEAFFFNTLLRFPQAPTIDGQFGNAIHETLEWLQYQIDEKGMPAISKTLDYFTLKMRGKKLNPDEMDRLVERGRRALKYYLAEQGNSFKPGDKAEYNFRNEGSFVNEVRLGGKIDRMEIDTKAKTITVVDYKTGKCFDRWSSDPKLHKFRQQLYCYKLLIENSHTFAGYKVLDGRIEFIEPDQNSKVCVLNLKFEEAELERTKDLLAAMWRCVKQLKLPDVSNYDTSFAGTKKFEADLLKSNK